MSEFCKIDFSDLNRDQVETIAQHLMECVVVQLSNNNEFIAAMHQTEDLPEACTAVMNAWSTRSNYISAKSDDELARIVAGDQERTFN